MAEVIGLSAEVKYVLKIDNKIKGIRRERDMWGGEGVIVSSCLNNAMLMVI